MANQRMKKNFFDCDWNTDKDLRFDFFNPKLGIMCNDNCPVIFMDIISLLAKDCDYNLKECYIDCKRLIISGIHKNEKSEIMLRYAGSNNELVVARICFIERHCGKMTELYGILKRIQKKYKTGKIVIESAVTEEMKHWCIKNGFELHNQYDYIEK